MNKYTLLFMVTAMTSVHAHADWYSGINLGINTTTVKKDLMYPLEDAAPSSSHFNNAYTNFRGQFLAGYERFFAPKISVGIEGNAEVFAGKNQYTINRWYFDESVHAEEQLKYGFSFFLLPIYHYNKLVHFFIGPGISTDYFDISASNTAGNIGVSTHFSKWLTGGGLKTGTIIKLTKQLDLTFTYQFTQYTGISKTQIEPLSEETLQGSYKPNVNAVLIGLRIHVPEKVRV